MRDNQSLAIALGDLKNCSRRETAAIHPTRLISTYQRVHAILGPARTLWSHSPYLAT